MEEFSFLEAALLMKRKSWSIMRQPNQAAMVPIYRMKATRKAQNRCRPQDSAKEVIPMGGGGCQLVKRVTDLCLS